MPIAYRKRLQRLETMAVAQADNHGANLRWLSTAPEPVQRYVAALVDEYWVAIDGGTNKAAATSQLLGRHPLYRPIQSLLLTAMDAGESVSLRRVQAHVLYLAGRRLPFRSWPSPEWERWRLIQVDYMQHLRARACCTTMERRADWDMQAWRKSGTTDLEVLAAAGIGALEYQLLAADE